MSKRTPGPWEVGQHPVIKGWIVKPVLFSSKVKVLPECEGGHIALKNLFDAKLIAAAPYMLEALKQIVNEWRDTPNFADPDAEGYEALQQCVKAIEKAEGDHE